jgi:hypothetical protein
MMLQHFVYRVSSATPTCCDICILMFHCDLANVANVEFQCCRHVMLGVVSRRRGGRAPDVGCCTQHRSQHGRTTVQHVGEGGRKTPDVACCTKPRSQHARNMFATCSQHRSLSVARTTVRNIGKALHNIAKVVRNICYASQRDRRLIGSLHPNRVAQDPSDASARIGHPGASSSVFHFT